MHPDFEIMIRTKTREAIFAVECKWREGFTNGKVEWAKDYQLKNYVEYQKSKSFPVFVIIGIGRSPDFPEHLFIISLKDIYSTTLNEKQLKEYLRSKKGDFFYDIDKKILQ
jgi:hypothetical protein